MQARHHRVKAMIRKHVLHTGTATATLLALTLVLASSVEAQPVLDSGPATSRDLYVAGCAACHGDDGTGRSQPELGFAVPMPDFTDCSFASREPDSDWFAVAHDGGPARGFDRLMPAFGDGLTDEEIQATLDYIRTLCTDPSWPRGELNLPRAMFTEKAFPEDEAVWTTGVAVEGPGAIANEFIYEKRFGARNQVELVVPFAASGEGGSWNGGIGDIAAGVKRAVYHRLESGTIFSVAGEVILPTGHYERGFGAGVTRLEPFVSLGQTLPAEAFIHAQAGAEIPIDRDRADPEAFWRGAIGRTFTEGRFGRAWSPMIEVLGARDLVSGASTSWDIVPQFHVTLNTRQHVMANVAVRVPLTDTAGRHTQILVFLLLDWFDGGILEGW
jgi:mono/diheme cytochrome c family protein